MIPTHLQVKQAKSPPLDLLKRPFYYLSQQLSIKTASDHPLPRNH